MPRRAPKASEQLPLYGNMEWFDVDGAEQPSPKSLPAAFAEARALWEQSPKKHQQKIVSLLAPFVRAWFVPAAIEDSEELFPSQDDCPASRINVVAVDFASSPLPKCKAEAWFAIDAAMTQDEAEQWIEDRGAFLSDALTFGWAVPKPSGKGELVFTYGSHGGAEALFDAPSDDKPKGNKKKDASGKSKAKPTQIVVQITGLGAPEKKEILKFLKKTWAEEARVESESPDVTILVEKGKNMCVFAILNSVDTKHIAIRCGES